MATLRISFLSSLILELLATISVALVAVAVGLRLLGGHLDYRTALFVLVLAPEAYFPCASWACTTTPVPTGWRRPNGSSRSSNGPRPPGAPTDRCPIPGRTPSPSNRWRSSTRDGEFPPSAT